MKKFLSLLCMITCIFGLTACGSTEEYTAYEQSKIEVAKKMAVEMVVPSFEEFKTDVSLKPIYEEYTAEEVAFAVQEVWGIEADGYAFMIAVESFTTALDTIGEIVSIGEATAKIDGKQIIVNAPVQGSKGNATAEVIFSNDRFTKFESAALNPEASVGDLMGKAALNTLIGMGTVFVVLILICLIISAFSLIPKIQAMFSKKKEKDETTGTTGIDNAVAQITTQEESVVEMSDDLELVAVIAAAIAASEGATSTDGFVVRSIRKVRR